MITNKKKVYVLYCNWNGDCLGIFSSFANCMRYSISKIEDIHNEGGCSEDFKIEKRGKSIIAIDSEYKNLIFDYYVEEQYLDENI